MKKILNSFTTPSGRSCEVQEITNKEYKIILKYAQGNNLRAFFTYLDEIILETIEDFNDFDIIDKIYVYISLCFFSIRGSIIFGKSNIGDNEISLVEILDNIEESYKNLENTVFLNENIKVKCSIPKSIIFDGEFISIDYLSSVESISGIELSKEEKNKLLEKLSESYKIKLNSSNKDFFILNCNLIKGDISLSLNLISSEIFELVLNLYNEDLDSLYSKMYNAINYLKLSVESFYMLTPLELDIIFNKWIKDKTENKEQAAGMALEESMGF